MPDYKFAGVLNVEANACQHVFVRGRFRPPTTNKPDIQIEDLTRTWLQVCQRVLCGSRRLPARFRQWAFPPADDG